MRAWYAFLAGANIFYSVGIMVPTNDNPFIWVPNTIIGAIFGTVVLITADDDNWKK